MKIVQFQIIRTGLIAAPELYGLGDDGVVYEWNDSMKGWRPLASSTKVMAAVVPDHEGSD